MVVQLALGLLASLLLAGALLNTVRTRNSTHPLSAAAALVLVAIVVVTASAASRVESVVRTFWNSRETPSLPNSHGLDLQSGVGFGAREDFLHWLDGRIPSHAKVYLYCGFPRCQEGHNQWLGYRFAPHRWTDTPEQADWLVFYSMTPRTAGITPESLINVDVFAPDFLIAQLAKQVP